MDPKQIAQILSQMPPPKPADDSDNFGMAIREMGLTPQEQNLYAMHLYNLSLGGVKQPNGATSTLLQAGIQGPDGRQYNIPTVWDAKILPIEDAIKKAREKGLDYFPSYDNPDQAEERYQQMHDYMERDIR